MRATTVLLTHFSQRYPKAVSLTLQPPSPTSSPSTKEFYDNQVLALGLDLVKLKIGEMWKMKYFQPAIEAMYATLPDAEDAEGEMEGVETAEGGGGKKEKGKQGEKQGKKEKGPAQPAGKKSGGKGWVPGQGQGKKNGAATPADVTMAEASVESGGDTKPL